MQSGVQLSSSKTYSTSEVAQLLGVSTWLVKAEIHRGHLAAIRVGGKWRVLRRHVDALLEGAAS